MYISCNNVLNIIYYIFIDRLENSILKTIFVRFDWKSKNKKIITKQPLCSQKGFLIII